MIFSHDNNNPLETVPKSNSKVVQTDAISIPIAFICMTAQCTIPITFICMTAQCTIPITFICMTAQCTIHITFICMTSQCTIPITLICITAQCTSICVHSWILVGSMLLIFLTLCCGVFMCFVCFRIVFCVPNVISVTPLSIIDCHFGFL